MKLLGYTRVKGEKDGKSWDYYRLYIEKECNNDAADSGGSQIVVNRSDRGFSFPTVPAEQFNKLIHSGMRSGSEINCYRDFDNHLIVSVM